MIVWTRVYSLAAAVFYGATAALLATSPRGPGGGPVVAGAIVFGLFHLGAALVPFRPWGWLIGLVALCVGLPSCLVIAAGPLLYWWLKPDTKAAFGRM